MGLFKSLDSMPKDGIESSISPKFVTIEYSVQAFVEKLKHVDQMSNQEIQEIICRQYSMFLDYDLFLSDLETKKIAQEMFTNERFLYNLNCCIPHLNLNEHQVICCNKLAYDYIAYHTATDCNPVIRDLLMDLSMRVNYKLVNILSEIVGTESAKCIAMFHKSSFEDDKNIRRVNRYLIKSGLELREAHIFEIYMKLYSSVTNLFTVTMLTMPEDDYTNLEAFRYDEMSKCMVDILESMPTLEIKRVLENYSITYNLKGQPPVRFSLKDLHESYWRTKNAIEELYSEGVNVP